MKSFDELREYLAEQLVKVANKETTPAHANASSNLAGKILQTVKLELDCCKQAGVKPNVAFLGAKTRESILIAHDPVTGEVTPDAVPATA